MYLQIQQTESSKNKTYVYYCVLFKKSILTKYAKVYTFLRTTWPKTSLLVIIKWFIDYRSTLI